MFYRSCLSLCSSSISSLFGVFVKIRDLLGFLPPLILFLGPAFGKGRTASGKISWEDVEVFCKEQEDEEVMVTVLEQDGKGDNVKFTASVAIGLSVTVLEQDGKDDDVKVTAFVAIGLSVTYAPKKSDSSKRVELNG